MNNTRLLVVVFSLFVFSLLLIAKLFDIQILKSEELQYYANKQQTAIQKIRAERGLIYDRNNVLLVYNKNDYSFYVDLRMINYAAKIKIAEKFAKVLNKDKNYFLSLMNNKKGTILLAKKVPNSKAIVLNNLKISGLFSVEDPTRVYQYNDLASHLLGYVNTEYRGVNGIGKFYEDYLKGIEGERYIQRTASGGLVGVDQKESRAAKNGNNILLNIDKVYQTVLEEELDKSLNKYSAKSASGIIMNPNTGEVLAMANSIDYDPNKYWEYPDDARRNRILTDTYEPGSTFKAFTIAALIDKNLCRENEIINVENGKYKYRNVYILDTHRFKFLSVKKIIEESSNIGIAKLVQRIDDETYYKYLRAFGFGTYTSIDLPGETSGKVKMPNEWTAVTKIFMSYGYEISVTPIQLITAFSALVNGGILYEPHIVKQIINASGQKIKEFSPNIVRRVISKNTSDKLREFLKGVVDEGTGKQAQLQLVSVGGKTGTSQKLINGEYSKENYNSSFIGFFPVENPQIVILILVNSPKLGRYGGAVAAPIFKNIAQKIIQLNPSVIFKNMESGEKDIPEIQLKLTNNNSDTETNLEDFKSVTSNNKNTQRNLNVVPDLINLTVRDAIIKLNSLGIKYKILGSGRVVKQSISSGTKVSKNSVLIIECSSKPFTGASF